MTSGAYTSKQFSAVRGVVILILAAIPLRMIGSVQGPWFGLPQFAGQGACVYQVVRDETCLGTMLMGEASSLSQILPRVGAAPRERLDDPKTAIPCNCLIRIEDNLPARVERMSGRHLVCAGQRIDVNLANAKDFTALPCIGPALAGRIVQYRDLHGPFTSTTELRGVPGIGKKRMAAIAPFIAVNRVSSGQRASRHPGRTASVSPSTQVSQKPSAERP